MTDKQLKIQEAILLKIYKWETLEIYNNEKWDNRHLAYLTKEQKEVLEITWRIDVPIEQKVQHRHRIR